MERSVFNDDFPWAQFGLTILVCLTCLIFFSLIGYLAAVPLFHIHPFDLTRELENMNNVPLLKYFQVVQSFGLFLVPSLLLGRIFSGNGFGYLKMNKTSSGILFFIVSVVMLSALPVINLMAELNSMIRLPESMSGLQQLMEKSSLAYQAASEAFLKVTSWQGLVVNLFVIALLPALGEELLFRGVIQRIFCNMAGNYHIGILISGFLFSFMHFEFFAFFPRWALGIMFGYMLLWSGSIWLPVLAHFINNSLAVVIYYFVSAGMVDKKSADFGSSFDILPYTILSGLVMSFGLFFLYKKYKGQSMKYV
jgi:uncharacterized protein